MKRDMKRAMKRAMKRTMNRAMKTSVMILAMLLVTSAGAQEVSIGALYQDPGQTTVVPDQATTWVNLSAPATVAGTINTVTLLWVTTGPSCPASYRIRFFRRSITSTGGNGAFTTVATRGPFTSSSGMLTVAISPGVPVQVGDVIGVIQAAGGTCGGVAATGGGTSLQSVFIRGDAEAIDLRNAAHLNLSLQARGSTSGRVFEGTITAAGSLTGNNGSFFRTSVHLTNAATVTPITGELVFHPAGVAASPADPKLPFTIDPKKVLFYEDVVAALGRSGLGSIDLYSFSSPSPIVNVRVFDDQGPEGTSGFTEELIRPSQALNLGSGTLALSPPPNFRTNIGVRSVGGPGKVQLNLYDATGKLLNVQSRDLPPDTFIQYPLQSLFGASSNQASYVRVFLSFGSSPLIVYASTTDNRTNDSSVQFVRMNGD